jgi:hypothetical protein
MREREREIPKGTGGRETFSEREVEADWTELHTSESALQKLDIAASIFATIFPLFPSRGEGEGRF